VAARGLDVSDLTHVINYNLPDDVEIYTHRSGRTGRANKKGIAVSIIHSKEKFKIKDIERMLRKTFVQEKIPNGLEVCKKQLFYMIDRMENVEVNDTQIEPYMNQIMKQLEYLSKEEILKRFVSIEFNRFLSYYKDSEDLNLPERNERSERGERGERGDRPAYGDRGERGAKSGNRVRLKMNVGDREGIDPKRFLGIVNDITGDKSISIGAIEVTNKFTFFDVFADQVDKVISAFSGQTELIVAEAKGSKTFEGGNRKPEYSPRSGGNSESRGGYRGSERATATTGTDKPWRSESGRNRTGGDDRKSGGYKGGSSSYKKRS
jgi:ATP-dependent RNA helicase DeaD